MADLKFDVVALDRASSTFVKMAAQVERLAQRLDALDRKEVTVRAKVDKSVTDSIIHIDRLGSALSKLAKPVAIGASIPTLMGVAAAAGSAAQSIGLLPAVGAAGAAAFGALKVGMTGFGDAMKNIGDPEKFAESIGALSTNARAAAVTIRDLGPAWTSLRMDVQNALFQGTGATIGQLADVYLPVLRAGLGATAGALNQTAKGVAEFVMQAGTVSTVSGIFGQVQESMELLAPVGASVVSMLVDIAAVGSEFLPGLADGFAAGAESAAAFIAQARQSGQLKEFLSDGLSAVGDLAVAFVNMGSIVSGVFRAAGVDGAGFAETIRDATGSVAELVNSASGQSGLAEFFGTLRSLADALWPVLVAVGRAVLDMVNAIAPSLPALGQAFARIVESASPMLGIFATLVGSLLPPLASLLDTIAPILGPIAAGFIAITTAVGIYNVTVGLITKATAAWATVQAVLNGTLVLNPIGLVVVALAALAAGLVLAWQHSETFRNIVMAAWDGIKVAASAAWENVLKPVFEFIVDYWQMLGDGAMWLWQNAIVPAWDGIKAGVSAAWDILRSVFDSLVSAVQTVGQWAMWLWENAIKPAFEFIADAARVLFAVVGTVLLTPIIIAFQAVGAAAMFLWENAIRPAWNGIQAAISFAWTNVIQPVWRALVDFINDVIVPVSMFLWNEVIRPAWDGIGVAISFVWNNVIKPVWDALVGFINNGLIPTVMFLWNDVIRPAWDGIGAIIGFAWNNVIKPIWDALVGFVRNGIVPTVMFLWNDVIRPAWDGIGGAISFVWTNVILPVFEALKGGVDLVGRAFEAAVGFIGRVWDGVKQAVRAPVQAVIDVVYNNGVVKAWNLVAGLVGLPALATYTMPAFAKGGPVTKPTVGLIGEAGDEYVLSAPAVRALGGVQGAEQMHRRLLGGGDLAAESEAGAPPGPGNGRAGIMTWSRMWSVIRGQFPGARLTSAIRRGDDGSHGSGQAIDVAGPSAAPRGSAFMARINKWISEVYPNSTELIYTPGINLKDGRPHTYGPDVRAAHYNHVHWALTRGLEHGKLPPGTGYESAGFDPFGWLKEKVGDFRNVVSGLIGGNPWADAMLGMGKKLVSAAWDFLASKATDAFGVGDGSAVPVGPVRGLTGEQTRNAGIIMGVGRGMGFPRRGLVVALATALQESGLRNINFGDRDSVGLFQQRPSQGWGSVAQIMDPAYSSRKFFEALRRVRNWQSLPVTVAAQRVQRSAFPNAYAKWQPTAEAAVSAAGFANGGLIDRPTFGLIGEAGPEAVVPLTRPQRAAEVMAQAGLNTGMTTVNHYTLNLHTQYADADSVLEGFARLERLNG